MCVSLGSPWSECVLRVCIGGVRVYVCVCGRGLYVRGVGVCVGEGVCVCVWWGSVCACCRRMCW